MESVTWLGIPSGCHTGWLSYSCTESCFLYHQLGEIPVQINHSNLWTFRVEQGKCQRESSLVMPACIGIQEARDMGA